MLFNLCAGMVKQRTCFTNYAPLWANMKFLHDNFRLTQFSAIFYIYQIYLHCRTVYEDLGYPWSKFQDFLEKEQVAAMQSLHIETGFPFFIHWKIIHFCQTTLCPWSSVTWLAFWSGPTSSQPTRWTKTKYKGDFDITICKTYICVGQNSNWPIAQVLQHVRLTKRLKPGCKIVLGISPAGIDYWK